MMLTCFRCLNVDWLCKAAHEHCDIVPLALTAHCLHPNLITRERSQVVQYKGHISVRNQWLNLWDKTGVIGCVWSSQFRV